MKDIFESLKTFILTDEHLESNTEIIPIDPPWNKGLTGYTTQPCSEETKLKISNSRKGSVPYNKGMTSTAESKQKNRESHIGKTHSEESKHKIKNALVGKTHSEETKKKQSESAKGKNTWLKGKPRSDKTKRKIAEAQARRHAIRKALNHG
jgi:hypothetical protein